MAGPTLIAKYTVLSAGPDNSTLVTPSFTPANGEVFVVKGCTWDTGNGMGTPTGGGQTYQQAVIGAPGGFAGWAGLYVCTVSGSPGPMTVSWPPGTAGNTHHTMFMERWGNAKLAATPAVNGTTHGVTANFSTPLTTVGDNSIISWAMVEENSVDPATRAYTPAGSTEDGIYDGHVGANSVHYGAYTAALSPAGSYNFGLTLTGSPTLNWTAVAVEVQAAAVVTSQPGRWGMHI